MNRMGGHVVMTSSHHVWSSLGGGPIYSVEHVTMMLLDMLLEMLTLTLDVLDVLDVSAIFFAFLYILRNF